MRNKFRGANFLKWCFRSWATALPLSTGFVALAFAIATFVNPFCWVSGGKECSFAWGNFWLPYDGKGTALQMVGTGTLYAVAAFTWEFSNIRTSIRAYMGNSCIQWIEFLSLAGYFVVLLGLYYDLWEKNDHTSRFLLLIIAGLFWITGWVVILRELRRVILRVLWGVILRALFRWVHTYINKP